MKRTIIAGDRRIEYTLIKAARKNVLFQALPGGVTRVYAPSYMRLREIDEMVRQRADQIADMHQTVDRHLEEDRINHPVSEGSTLMIEGKPHIIRLHQGKRIKGEIIAGEYHITLPEPGSDPHVRAAIRSALSVRALERIRERLAHYQPMVGKPFGRVTIRDQKSRWGSCSQKHNLNFNWKLIMAPPEALDYVVIHELCHLHEFNHSPRFWQLVRNIMPEYEFWKKWLKEHTEDLYL